MAVDEWIPEGAPRAVDLGGLKLTDEGEQEPASPTRDKLTGKHNILSPTSIFAAGVWSPTPGATPLKKSKTGATMVMGTNSYGVVIG